MNYDPFVNTKEGQALYNGVLSTNEDFEKVHNIDEEADQPKNLYAYLIKNDLLTRKKRKRGDPIEPVMARRDFSIKHNRASDSLDSMRLKAKPLSKFKEVKHIYNRNDIKRPPLKVITARINEHYRKQNTKEYLSSWLYERR